MSFREDVMLQTLRVLGEQRRDGELNEIAKYAQTVAEAGCEKWGHDDVGFYPSVAGAGTIASLVQGTPAPSHTTCKRCGRTT